MELDCPVTSGYLRALRNLFDLESVQFELWQEPLDEVENMATFAGNSRRLQRQRAFYCVEVMASRFNVQSKHPDRRSREGLNELIAIANRCRDDIRAELVEVSIIGEVLEGRAERHYATQRAIAHTLQLTCEAAVLLRQSLKNPDTSLSRVGKRLALAAFSAGYYIDNMLELAKELIDYTEGSARRAWEPARR